MAIYLLQIFCFILFGVMVYVAKKRRELWLLILATIFAAFFENLDIILAQGKAGSYFYDPRLILSVIDTPIFIILSWGAVFYSAYILVQGLAARGWIKILTLPLLVLILDLPVDPVATRLGLWTWVDYGPADGILGVPLTNFIGWYLVMLAFVISLAIVPHIDFLGRLGKYIIIPPFAFIIFVLMFSLYGFASLVLGINKENEIYYFQLFLFLITLIPLLGWLAFPHEHKVRFEEYFTALGARVFFYGFGLVGVFVLGLWHAPLFILMFIFAVVLEVVVNLKFIFNYSKKLKKA